MELHRVVYDCNVFLQALISPEGPSGRCLTLVLESRVGLFCSEAVIEELREVASRKALRSKFRHLTEERLETFVGGRSRRDVLF